MLSGNKKWVAAAAAAAGLSLAVGLYLRSRSKARAGAGEAERRPKAPVPAEEAELRARYARDGQGHVFDMLDAGLVDDADRAAFLAQLAAIDTQFLNEVFTETMAGVGAVDTTLTPVEEVVMCVAAAPLADKDRWTRRGLEAVAAGEAAALVLAGGQGSRLGFNRPKGEYDLNLPSHKTLFEIQAARIKKVRQLAAQHFGKAFSEVSLPWYIMTSPMTHEATQSYFEEQNFFGLGAANVVFFSQGTLPCLTTDGKIMLESAGRVAEAPDGNGGIYRALHRSGCIADMQRRGVKYIHAFAVDNAVCKVADPMWIGYGIETKAETGCKVLTKSSPDEKIGALCRKAGKFAVVEYSDIDEVNKNKRNPDGSFTFRAGFVCMLFYHIDFLKNKCKPQSLPRQYHVAHKKIPYADPKTGATIPKEKLTGNTGIKLESFIFDVFPQAERLAAFDVVRAEEFSPVKNKTGGDSPATARQMFSDMSVAWLEAEGATVSAASGGAVVAEVSPLVSYCGEGLQMFAGMKLKAPLLVQAECEATSQQLAGVGPVRMSKMGDVTVYTVMD